MDPRVEMFQRGQSNDAFFNMKALAPRPLSEATMFDTDFEDDDDSSIIEDDSSPRISLNSVSSFGEQSVRAIADIKSGRPKKRNNIIIF